jgi:hypothetical protein
MENNMNSHRISRFVQLSLILCAVLAASAVSIAQTVNYNVMPGTDFAKYHTYKWVTVSAAESVDAILDQQIRMAVDSQLAAKGFVKTDAATADLSVAYQGAIKQQQQWNAYGMGGGYRWGGGMATATQTTLNIGTLDFDVYDQAAKTLIWRGTVTKTLNTSANQIRRQQNLNKAIAKLLQNFPPPPPKR